eukprot:scaffold294609_cov41-Tisochrysis_lutea.AAC.1
MLACEICRRDGQHAWLWRRGVEPKQGSWEGKGQEWGQRASLASQAGPVVERESPRKRAAKR